MSLGKIVVELELKDGDFHVRTLKAGAVVKELSDKLDRASTSLGRIERGVTGFLPRLRDFIVTATFVKGAIQNIYMATFGWQKAIIDANAEIERMTMLLYGMSKAGDAASRSAEAAQNVKDIFKMAESAPFSIGEITNSFVKMKSVGLDPLDGSLKSLLDGVAAFGGNDQILHRASIAIQQMAGKGVISMEELRQQLGEAVPRSIELMARSMNMTYAELVKAVSTGSVEAKDALARMTGEFQRVFTGAGDNMMQTWTGMTQVLINRWMVLAKTIGDAGLFDEAKKQLQSLLDALDSREFKSAAASLGAALASIVVAIADVVKFMYEWWDVIMTVTKAAIALWAVMKGYTILTAVKTAVGHLTGTLLMNGVAHYSALAAVEKYTLGNKASIAMSGAAAIASRGLGVAMAALGGPIGIAIAAVAALAFAFIDFGNKGEEALQKVRDGIADLDDFKDAQKEIEKLQDQINRLEKHEGLRKNGWVGLQDLSKELAQAKDKLASFQKDVANGREDFEKSQADKFAQRRMRDNQAALQAISSHYDKVRQVIDDNLKKTGNEAQFKKDSLAALNDYYEKTIGVHVDQTQKIQAYLDSQGKNLTDTQKREWNAALNAHKTATDDLRKQWTKAVKDVNSKPMLLNMSGNADEKKSKSGMEQLEQVMDRTTAKIKEADAEMKGLSGDWAKLESLIQGGYYGAKAAQMLANQDAFMVKLREEVLLAEKKGKEAKNYQDHIKGIADARARLDKETISAAEEIESLRQKIDSAGGENEGSFTRRIEKFAEQVKKDFPELINGTDEFKKKLDDLGISAQKLDSYRWFDKATESTREMTNALKTERQRIDDTYKYDVMIAHQRAALHLYHGEERKKREKDLYDYLTALQNKYLRDTEHPIQKLARDWEDSTERMKQASANWLNDFSEKLTDFAITGKADFKGFADAIIRDLVRIMIQKQLAGIAGNLFGNTSTTPTTNSGGTNPTTTYGDTGNVNVYQSAMGNVIGPRGAMKLRKYATGGIANSPQLSIFGEGDTPEAYVPLPDGRSIPVSMEGGGGTNVAVQVNVINQTTNEVNAEQGETRFDGEKYILDVVLKGVSRPGSFKSGLKAGLR